MSSDVTIVPITDIAIYRIEGLWPVPEDMRGRVEAHWQRALAANPHLWDGRVLGVTAPGYDGGIVVENGVLRASAREDAFSLFLTWRDEGFAEIGVRNLFGSALVLSSDGALIYGVMAGDTANAGRIYPPGGSLEPRDVRTDGFVDLVGSIELELMEETGLDHRNARAGEMLAAFDGPRVSIGRIYRFDKEAEALIADIRADLPRQEHRELEDVVALRKMADVELYGERVPPYAQALARHLLA